MQCSMYSLSLVPLFSVSPCSLPSLTLSFGVFPSSHTPSPGSCCQIQLQINALSSPEAFHNTLILPAGVKTALIITLNIHVFDNTRS